MKPGSFSEAGDELCPIACDQGLIILDLKETLVLRFTKQATEAPGELQVDPFSQPSSGFSILQWAC